MRWVYSYDGLGRRVAKTCLNTDTGEIVSINLTANNNDAAGVSGWSQARVDAMFYALVADLAGAPQELIDTDEGRRVV